LWGWLERTRHFVGDPRTKEATNPLPKAHATDSDPEVINYPIIYRVAVRGILHSEWCGL
jgi:hypothetical protein